MWSMLDQVRNLAERGCGDEQKVDFSQHLDSRTEVVICNYAEPALIKEGTVILRPWEALVLRRSAVSDLE
jgi:hypothetical protein